jgi:hypothetical protein
MGISNVWCPSLLSPRPGACCSFLRHHADVLDSSSSTTFGFYTAMRFFHHRLQPRTHAYRRRPRRSAPMPSCVLARPTARLRGRAPPASFLLNPDDPCSSPHRCLGLGAPQRPLSPARLQASSLPVLVSVQNICIKKTSAALRPQFNLLAIGFVL